MIEIKKGVYKLAKRNVNDDDISVLEKRTRNQGLKMARICLHKENTSKLMSMIIIVFDKYIYPAHKHVWKNETYTILKGSCLYQEFTDKAQLDVEIKLNKGDCMMNDRQKFHRIVPCTNVLCFIEHTTGPFTGRPNEFLK